MELAGRVAVVIGGGSGIGRGVAIGLSREQMRVAVADIDGAAAEGAREAAGGALAAAVDATDPQLLRGLAERVTRELGAPQVLVCTVGAIVDRRIADASEAEWAWLLEANLMAQVRAVAAFLPSLTAGRPAHVVLTASMGGLLAEPAERSRGYNAGLYVTAKHALVGYADMLRLELAAEGIGVSLLCPTRVAGDLAATSARHRPERFGGPLRAPSPAAVEGLMEAEAVGRLVARAIRQNRFYIFTHPEEVAKVEERHRRLLDDAAFWRGR